MRRIAGYAPALRAELRSLIERRQSDFSEAVPWGQDFLRRLGPFATSGKMIRGGLVCFAYETFSGEAPTAPVIRTALALELIHSALLIHDDIMDNDELRRGKPSMHSQYRHAASTEGIRDPSRFGINMALAGGDMAFFLAFDLLSSPDLRPQAADTIKRLFVDQLIIVCSGQMQDVYFDSGTDLPGKKEIVKLMEEKTASYTIALPLLSGAVLGGADAATLSKLRRFGVAAGTIFQIRDDELGLMGDTADTGKPVGSDITAGKKTLLYYYLSKRCTAKERRQLATVFGNADSSPADIDYVRKLVKERGVLEILQRDINRLETKARAAIATLPIADTYKQELAELVTFCAQRRT